jgi:V8-like Glu-specific endopeptidase
LPAIENNVNGGTTSADLTNDQARVPTEGPAPSWLDRCSKRLKRPRDCDGGTMGRQRKRLRAFVVVACAMAIGSASSTAARIIGEDGRRTVSEQERQRYLGIGIVTVSSGRRVYGGTGTLINDRLTVLTAFHNVFHDGKTGPIGQVQAPMRMMHFLVGDRLTRYPIKSIRPFNRDYDGFVLADENDLAVITLQKPVAGVEPVPLRALAKDDDGRGLGPVTLVAYAGLTKKLQECRFHERAGSYPRSPDILVHDCDSEGNASGAPLLDASGAIVAIHLGGSPRGVKAPGLPFSARTNFNIARRMTSDVQRFVARETPGAAVASAP